MAKIIQIDWKKEELEQAIEETSVLRHEAKVVSKSEFGKIELKKILEDMKDLMEKEKDGVAIAAPQIGISKRIFVVKEEAYKVNNKDSKWKPLIFINPKIIKFPIFAL